MKKLLSLMAAGITLFLAMSCDLGNNLSNSSPESQEITMSVTDLRNSVWFSDGVEICFPYENETLYINYMPDTLNTTKWISLKENADGSFTAKIEWSENIREIGTTSETSITKKGNTITVKCDFFEYKNMESYEGVTASSFDVSKVPALKSEYLSNWRGKYTLNSKKYEFSVDAKVGMSADVNHYWNANVLNTTVLDNGTYDLLLAHSSSNNGTGSIDPGITGQEPFISKQGLFWSHLTLTPNPGSQWEINWSSVWYDSPYEALQGEMDMKDSFTGPETTKITYTYNFYFGNPKLKESGYGVEAENPVLIKADSFESNLPTSEAWKDILKRAGEFELPEGKLADYWWYNTDSSSPIMESSVYKLSDSWEPALNTYDFYLALKDKPEDTGIYYQEGQFKNTSGAYDLTVSSSGITYNEKAYTFVDGAVWTTANDGESPLQYCYVLSDGEKKYYCMIEWYPNNIDNKTNKPYDYINFREPKITEEEDPIAEKGSRAFELFGSRRGTLKKQ